jgi:hypothetical protein
MFFNSLTFALFLPVVLLLFWLLPRSWRTGLLVVASYVFYGWWDVRFLSLIVISTVVDFVSGRRIHLAASSVSRRRWLWLSLCVNLGILGFFKYWGFFVDSASSFLVAIGADAGLATLRIVLPVGISFYTFQTLSYTIDVYRWELEPEPNLLRFALFVSFFPQLVAGPIERARRLLPQLRSFPERIADVDWSGSAALIFRGLFRKVVIADGVAPLVNEVFSKPDVYGAVSIAMAVVGFSLLGGLPSLLALGTAPEYIVQAALCVPLAVALLVSLARVDRRLALLTGLMLALSLSSTGVAALSTGRFVWTLWPLALAGLRVRDRALGWALCAVLLLWSVQAGIGHVLGTSML